MNDFLPNGYEVPETERRFMEFEEGANTFRILSTAIVGYEWWEETGNGDRVPVRVRTAEEVPQGVKTASESRNKAKHFWAFTAYNYEAKSIQVLEIKQQTIMRAIEALLKKPKWGNPQGYDLTVEKVKTGGRDLDVEYHVIPEPPSPLDEGIVELAKQVPVRLEALYEGQDPFALEPQEDEAGEKDNGKRAARAERRAQASS
jgi:hypothetical protein